MSFLLKVFWTLWHFWFKLPDKVRFVLVGGFNACVQYVLYVLFLWMMGKAYYQAALVLSWILSTFSSFTTQVHSYPVVGLPISSTLNVELGFISKSAFPPFI